VKAACTVWSGGKSGDYIKGLPIAIRSQVPGNQAAYGRGRGRSDRYTACTITGESVLAGAVGKENTHG